VEAAYNGEDALQLMDNFSYDAIILDWTLPDLPGIEVCQRYRKGGGRTYIIFLTGKGDIDDREAGLDAGSDDYVVKPFNVRELSARVRTVLRRPQQVLPFEITIADVTLDPRTRDVIFGGERVHLMPKELALLEFLMRHPNEPYSAQGLLDAVWPSESEASCETVRTWMMKLRQKLASLGKRDFIKTLAGSGYLIEFAG
jgi:DNA-binding response OmpR family regulator